jgi:3-isopropylmalate/(R)-2-methylmalate dehydratase small subunit
MNASNITRVSGPAIVLPGNDIDTDRIMPARFLKAITFSGLEAHVFEDDRREAAGRGVTHVFDDPARRAARVLIAGSNFGCGSSREHAPQALYRWGLRAVVAESFAEIFAGNSLMIGLVCVTASHADLEALRRAAEDPAAEISVDIAFKHIVAGEHSAPVQIPDATRNALVSGAWDATGLLLANYRDVEQKAAAIPYIAGF